MKFVITGSSGYIGTSFIERLIASEENQVIGLDRNPPHSKPNNRFEFIQCDLSSPNLNLNDQFFQGTDVVVHLAAARGDWAISTDEYWRDNLTATQGLLNARWSRKVPYWVFMSSVSVYGPTLTPLNETSRCTPIGSYGESKLASEIVFKEFIETNNLSGCSIRPSAVFSPGHPRNTNVYKLIESLRSFPIPLIDGGRNYKAVTYLPNLLDLIMWNINRMNSTNFGYKVYNYVENPVQTVAELISMLKDSGISPARTIPIPLVMALAASYPVYALARIMGIDLRVTPERVKKFASNTFYDSSLIRKEGFFPSFSLRHALRETAQWHLLHC